jgi:predicted peptidase
MVAGVLCQPAAPQWRIALAADTNEFLTRIYTNAANKTLPYRLLLPKVTTRADLPAILYLHGRRRGATTTPSRSTGVRGFFSNQRCARNTVFLIVPQCPRGSGLDRIGLERTFRPPGK